ncbi:hypothetical protein TorRG33x02_163380 [Trema orientale]|uniref:Uncharacterized protein n=1 Tax=Trema orientale TaxID=63057 RepID=A0A2P5EQZ4_TREOI|nr:hypothetical protein TorRG33x02_163380 [Trema orientale]
MRLSTIKLATTAIAAAPPVPIPPLSLDFALSGALGPELFEVRLSDCEIGTREGAGGDIDEEGGGDRCIIGGWGDGSGGEFGGECVGSELGGAGGVGLGGGGAVLGGSDAGGGGDFSGETDAGGGGELLGGADFGGGGGGDELWGGKDAGGEGEL